MTTTTSNAGDAAKEMIRIRSAQIVLIEDAQGLGTGLLVSEDGWILTNKHVAPSVGPYRVILANGKDVHGVGVHQSSHYDLAIVKINGSYPSFFDLEKETAEDIMVGEEVYALGHPRGCRFSVSRGVISNPHREFDKDYYVQTDASINPGNSGGPLVDREGKLVGIVTMMLAYSQGLGFAVPGYTAADYARYVRRLVRQGIVRIPEALLATAEAEKPLVEEVIRQAVGTLVETGRASVEEEKPSEGFVKLKRKTSFVEVLNKEGIFSVTGLAAALGPTELADTKFLQRLLSLSGSRDFGGASLTLKDNALYVTITRPTPGLDAVEAVWALDLVLRHVTDLPQKLHEMFYTGAGQGAPNVPAPNAAPPPPQANVAPAYPPQYPPQPGYPPGAPPPYPPQGAPQYPPPVQAFPPSAAPYPPGAPPPYPPGAQPYPPQPGYPPPGYPPPGYPQAAPPGYPPGPPAYPPPGAPPAYPPPGQPQAAPQPPPPPNPNAPPAQGGDPGYPILSLPQFDGYRR